MSDWIVTLATRNPAILKCVVCGHSVDIFQASDHNDCDHCDAVYDSAGTEVQVSQTAAVGKSA